MAVYDFNAAVKPISLRDLNAQYLDDQARRQNIARGQQEMQEGTIRLSELGQQQKDKQALRDATTAAYQKGITTPTNTGDLTFAGTGLNAGQMMTAPGTQSNVTGPGIDDSVLLSEVGKRAPHLVPQLQDSINSQRVAQQKQQAEQAKLNAEAQLAILKVGTQHFEDMAQELSGVVDQPSYTAALQRMAKRGIPGAAEMIQQHPLYDPQFVAQHVQTAVPVVEQLKAKQKDLEIKATAARDAANALHQTNEETLTKRGQDITARGQDMTDARARENTDNKKINSVQNRAALADNVEENLKTVEDVMQRRPDLFGKVSGNLSNAALAIGSNDPDKLAYNQAVENLSIANAGMHQMRSKYAIEGSIKNLNFKNGVDGVKGTVASIRKSAEQFKGEAGDATPAPTAATAPPAGATHAVKDARGNIIGYTSDGKTMTPAGKK